MGLLTLNGNVSKVTVLMSVYNGEKYLRQAIESILNQTFKDFEFLIIDDGSTDGTAEIIRSYTDPLIRFVQNEKNIGLTRSLNRGLKLAKGEYIARQDADDISLPERLEKQVSFLDSHSNVALLSSSIKMINLDDKEIGFWKLPCDNSTIKENLLKGLNQFSHPSSIFRKKCVEKVGGYRETFEVAQDYDLWLRIAEEFDVANLEEPLCIYRIEQDAVSAKNGKKQLSNHRLAHHLAVQRQILGKDELGYKPPGEFFEFLRSQVSRDFISRRKILSKRYFICAQNYAFMKGWRSSKMTLKLCLGSILNNPLNLKVWNYTACVLFDRLWKKNRDGKYYARS